MAWIKLDDNTYAKEASPDPSEIVHLDTLQGEINNLTTQITNLEKELLPYPDGADERLKEAVDIYNEQMVNILLDIQKLELNNKQRLCDELGQL